MTDQHTEETAETDKVDITALSLIIGEDLTMGQLASVMTERMNILISVQEPSENTLHFKVQAECADPAMLLGMLRVIVAGLEDGTEVFKGNVKNPTEADAMLAVALAEHGVTKGGE